MNFFIAITLAAFIMSAIPSSVSASSAKSGTSVVHVIDGQKSDNSPSHQEDGQCDDNCCINHCSHCAGYAMPATQALSIPTVSSSNILTFSNQKAEGSPATPQLRPPRHLA